MDAAALALLRPFLTRRPPVCCPDFSLSPRMEAPGFRRRLTDRGYGLAAWPKRDDSRPCGKPGRTDGGMRSIGKLPTDVPPGLTSAVGSSPAVSAGSVGGAERQPGKGMFRFHVISRRRNSHTRDIKLSFPLGRPDLGRISCR